MSIKQGLVLTRILLCSSLPDFYRHVLVFTPLAGSALGLFTVASLVITEWIQSKRKVSTRALVLYEAPV